MAKAPVKQAPVLPVSNRDGRGRFVPGNAANPHGRPRAEFNFTELLRGEIAKRPSFLMGRLMDLCQSENELVALQAVTLVINRIDGALKPTTGAGASLELDNGDGRRVKFSLVLGTIDGNDDSTD